MRINQPPGGQNPSPTPPRRLSRWVEDAAEFSEHTGRVVLQGLDVHGKTLQHAFDAGDHFSRTAPQVNMAIGAASLLVGASEMVTGVRHLRQGQHLKGSLDLIGGSSALIGGAACLGQGLGAGLWQGIPLAPVGAECSGVGAICDGIEDLLPNPRPGTTRWGGALKLATGGMLIAAGLTGDLGLQTAGSSLYVGTLMAQYGRAARDWMNKNYP